MLAAGTDRARPRALVLLALAALALHLLLLGGFGATGPVPGPASMPAPTLQVRSVPAGPAAVDVPVPMPADAPRPAVAVATARPPRVQAPPPVAPVVVALATEAAAPVPTAEHAATPAPVSEVAQSAQASAQASAPPQAPAESPPGGEPPPVYRTRLPPAAALSYDLQRGRLAGTGELSWRPDGERYELRLEGRVLGLNALTQVSQGAVVGAGLAPQRFTDQRLRRAAQAANFQRDAGRITFSGPSTELPLWPGVQDRLSWMIQLAGIAEAEPLRLVAGERIVLEVIGARGDASQWVFRSLGREPVDTAAGPVDAVHLSREARGPYDTAVEVWLDPTRHHLPIRATLRSGADEDLLDLRLRALVPGP